jgi:hypothetical protein
LIPEAKQALTLCILWDVFYDHGSNYIGVYSHVQQNANKIIESKLCFEREPFDYGIVLQVHHTHNGNFHQKTHSILQAYNQTVKLSGVGAHHQIDASEHAIRTISSIARNMLIHAAT